MSGHPSWVCLSVQDFFSRCDWQGKPLKPVFESASSGPYWLCLTVQELFKQSNWQGQPLTKDSNPARSSLSLTMPVSEFFQFIVWDGDPEIATLPQLALLCELTSSSFQNLKLADLSDLF